MRVVFIRSNPVSPYPRLEKTANSLGKAGHNGQVLAWDRSKKYNQEKSILELKDSNIPITRFGIPGKFGGGFKSNSIPLLKFQMKIFLWLIKNRNRYDVIHAYDFDTGYISMKSAKLLNKKLVYDIPDYYVDSHNLKNTKIGNFVEKMEKKVINYASSVIICTEKRKEQIKGSNPKNLTIVHNSPLPITKSKYDGSKFCIFSKKLKIVYVGILSDERFIKEIAEVVVNRNDCEFHVAGFGKLEVYFKEMCSKYENIYFYGKIPYNETLELESKCDLITAIYDPKIPNHYYAAPNKFYESLMLGKPIIMAKNTGMDDIVEKYGIGEVIEYSKQSLEVAIDNLIEKRNDWKNIAEISQKIYNNNYSWSEMERRLINLYEKIK
ncbi:glycosyltransferase family 4 protein [Paraclostridium bifermentans]|uniref:glycosyltransferase family 4 protein n=1 Tax=Paraclostridium bifermentans TaxID=1490 RepID=UPI0022E84B6E|nr:glycosyltransferase family 4 protein [Paraclostridium bifermentans]